VIVLDTNVISELFKPAPDANVLSWVENLPSGALYTTAVTRGELFYGLLRMPNGKRKEVLRQKLVRLFDRLLAGHVIAYDGAAADAYAELATRRRQLGRPIAAADAMIAGIVRSRGARLATRNVRDFEDCGIALIDPWQ